MNCGASLVCVCIVGGSLLDLPVFCRCRYSFLIPERVSLYGIHSRILMTRWEICLTWMQATLKLDVCCQKFRMTRSVYWLASTRLSPRLRETTAWPGGNHWLLWGHLISSTDTSMDKSFTCTPTTSPWPCYGVSRTSKYRQHAGCTIFRSTALHLSTVRVASTTAQLHSLGDHVQREASSARMLNDKQVAWRYISLLLLLLLWMVGTVLPKGGSSCLTVIWGRYYRNQSLYSAFNGKTSFPIAPSTKATQPSELCSSERWCARAPLRASQWKNQDSPKSPSMNQGEGSAGRTPWRTPWDE